MKQVFISFLMLLYQSVSLALPPSDSLITELNNSIKQTDFYDNKKLKEISQLKSLLDGSKNDFNKQYETHLKLYNAYKYYNYDSAFAYAKKLQKFAEYRNDPSLLADAKIKLAFIMLSGGMFKETFDTLNIISVSGVSANVMSEYYSLKARCFYDLADFDNDKFYSPLYNTLANSYLDSALSLYPANSFDYFYFSGLSDFKKGKTDSALIKLQKLIKSQNLSFHEIALTTSMIGGIFNAKGDVDEARDYLIQASIADIKSSTKETLALLGVAGIIFKEGNKKNAALYIEKANTDAGFYNARLRKVQIGAILPLIEGVMINTIELQKQKLITSLILLAILTLLLAGFALIIRKQVKNLKVARLSLLEANLKQQQINQQLVEVNELKEKYNDQLQQINRQLSEANKIKEEYIGYYFSVDTQFIARIEKIINLVDKKITDRKWDEVKYILKSADLKREKEDLLKNFDKVFVRLFPNFVTQFNTLFTDEDKIILKEGQLLNTDLRIFALIRLGITDNEKIAEILDYSINTIYSKKTKIRNKTTVSKDEFERKLIQITTLNL
ncbi:MAG: DUF6377 domain-containing protein [Ferruginibacter sp.]